MLLGQHPRGGHARDRGLQLVLPAGDDIAVAAHHRLEPHLGDVRRIVLGLGAHLRIEHVGPLEELRLGGARHEARHRDAAVLQLGAQRERERIDERLGAVVDRMEGAGHEARDRPRDEDPAAALCPHVLSDALYQVDGAGHVCINDVPNLVEVLVQERPAEPVAGIGEQRLHRPAVDGRVELVDAIERRQVGFHGIDGCTQRAERLGTIVNGRLIGRDQQVEAATRGDDGEFEADAARGTGDNGKGTSRHVVAPIKSLGAKQSQCRQREPRPSRPGWMAPGGDTVEP